MGIKLRNRLCADILLIMLLLCMGNIFIGCGRQPERILQSEDSIRKQPELDSWSEDSVNKQKIIEFVEDVTDEDSENFVPVEDRIATFDFDGTIISEKSTWLELAVAIYKIETELSDNAELVNKKDELLFNLKQNPEPDNTRELIEYVTGKAFEGVPQEDFIDYMHEFMQEKKAGFKDLRYADSFYKPMFELIAYLQENKFTVYIVSGSERGVMWGATEGILDLPRSQMIGGDITLIVDDRYADVTADTKGHNILEPDDLMFRGLGFTQHSAGNSKVYNIYHQIGIRPVFACGNTADDFSMLNYAKYNPKYKGFALLINHDDEEREYKYHTDKRQYWDGLAYKYEWNIVSMKNDFKNIFLKNTIKEDKK